MKLYKSLICVVVGLLLAGCATAPVEKEITPVEMVGAPQIEEKTAPNLKNLNEGLNDLTVQIVNSMIKGQKHKIAVVEFSDLAGHVTQLGMLLSEELITRLFKTDKFDVVERQLLTKIIEEQKLELTGIVDPLSAKELGKILGVDAIVSGTVTDLGESIKVNARLISTESGAIFSVAATEIGKDATVLKLMEEKVERVKKAEAKEPEEEKPSEEVEKPEAEYEPGLIGAYYQLPEYGAPFGLKPADIKIDQTVYFKCDKSPVESKYWGIRWIGEVYIPRTGTYQFQARCQRVTGYSWGEPAYYGPAYTLLQIGNEIIFPKAEEKYREKGIQLTGPGWHLVRFDYWGMEFGHVVLSWRTPDVPTFETIDPKYFRHKVK